MLIAGFTDEPDVIANGAEFLRIVSWNFLATGIIFTNSGMFQAMGNTMPALTASALRLVLFGLPAVWLTTYSGFELWHLWCLSAGTVTIQAVVSWRLLMGEFRRRLGAPGPGPAPQQA